MALTTKTHRSRPIGGGNTFQSKVDIIIPFHGQYHKVTRLIESILRFTHSNPYHLILVDDCSPNTESVRTVYMKCCGGTDLENCYP